MTAACAAIDHANSEGMGLAVLIFLSDDGHRMTVFGIDGIDVGEVLEVAARQTWDLTEDQPLRGCLARTSNGSETTPRPEAWSEGRAGATGRHPTTRSTHAAPCNALRRF
jgi:hypothetical protein